MKNLFCANLFENGLVRPAKLFSKALKINVLYKSQYRSMMLTADSLTLANNLVKFDFHSPKVWRIIDFQMLGFSYFCTSEISPPFSLKIRLASSFDTCFLAKLLEGLCHRFSLPIQNWPEKNKYGITHFTYDFQVITLLCHFQILALPKAGHHA